MSEDFYFVSERTMECAIGELGTGIVFLLLNLPERKMIVPSSNLKLESVTSAIAALDAVPIMIFHRFC